MEIIPPRAYLYGDGIFETMLCHRGRLPWLPWHVQRLRHSLACLGLVPPFALEAEVLAAQIKAALPEIHADTWRIRMSFFRLGGGLYSPQSDQVSVHYQAQPLAVLPYAPVDTGLRLGLYEAIRRPCDFLSNLKTSSALALVCAAQYRQAAGWDEVLLLNSLGQIAEASSSNIFVLHKKKIYTPSLDQGCLAGVLRAALLNLLPHWGYEVVEQGLSLDFLDQAEEIWLSNSILGLRWVGEWRDKRLNGRLGQTIQASLQHYLEHETVFDSAL